MKPVTIINNRNRLSTTKKLVEQLQELGYEKIVILDNGSTYPPLLQFYDSLHSVIVYRLKNLGPRAIYDSGIINSFKHIPWIAYTDSDIELNSSTPAGFIESMMEKAEQWGYTKAGLALRIDDIQPHQFGYKWKDWESKYWVQKIEKDVYHADVDTTFCVIKPTLHFDYRAIRIARDFTSIHVPWYTDFNSLPEEEKYYLDHSSDDSTYKREYKNYLSKYPLTPDEATPYYNGPAQ